MGLCKCCGPPNSCSRPEKTWRQNAASLQPPTDWLSSDVQISNAVWALKSIGGAWGVFQRTFYHHWRSECDQSQQGFCVLLATWSLLITVWCITANQAMHTDGGATLLHTKTLNRLSSTCLVLNLKPDRPLPAIYSEFDATSGASSSSRPSHIKLRYQLDVSCSIVSAIERLRISKWSIFSFSVACQVMNFDLAAMTVEMVLFGIKPDDEIFIFVQVCVWVSRVSISLPPISSLNPMPESRSPAATIQLTTDGCSGTSGRPKTQLWSLLDIWTTEVSQWRNHIKTILTSLEIWAETKRKESS